MKISFDKNLDGTRGLQRFGGMLSDQLCEQYDVKIVSKEQKSDIHFLIIHGSIKKGSKNVVRLDGIYYDIKRMGMNNPIRNAIKKVDGVIYQSNWCKKFVETMLKVKPKRSVIIYNGTDQSKFQKAKINKYGFDKIFLACAHWRVNKRLKSITKSFLKVCEKYPKLGFFVIGDADYKEVHDNIRYFNHVRGNKLYDLYKSSDYMCHICHLDACPNAVVEGLSAGLPVLCNNIGGTPEIVKNDGIILNLDKLFDFKAIKNMKVVGFKSVDQEMLSSGMLNMIEKEWFISRSDLDISVSARQYYDFFKLLLGA